MDAPIIEAAVTAALVAAIPLAVVAIAAARATPRQLADMITSRHEH